MPPGLWIVATPIGNLMDITSRACKALAEAELIFCEDTRRTGILLSSLGIARNQRLERLDAHTPLNRLQAWIQEMKMGGKFALVTDAGTPAVSDPGSVFVALAHEAEIQVTPIPGASAVLALLSVSGFQETAFAFRGFFPRKTLERKREIQLAQSSPLASICTWFESPLRILDTLTLVQHELPEARIIVAKELTKLHEKLFLGSINKVLEQIETELNQIGSVGEWCFGIQFSSRDSVAREEALDTLREAWVKALRCLAECGVSASEAVRKVSQHFGVPKKLVYQESLSVFGKKT